MKGRIVSSITFTENRRQRVTVELDGDFSKQYDELSNCELEITICRYRRKRSLDANAYAWVLIDKIAEKLGDTKENVYRAAIKEIGGVSEIVCVQAGAVDRLKDVWEHNGIGWQISLMPSKLPGCVNAVLYYGSSVYDTKQMSALINYLVDECEGLSIETWTQDKLALLLEDWNGGK